MDRLVAVTTEPISPDWFTIEDFARRYGYGVAHSGRILNRMVDSGTVEIWKGKSAVSKRFTHKYRTKCSTKK